MRGFPLPHARNGVHDRLGLVPEQGQVVRTERQPAAEPSKVQSAEGLIQAEGVGIPPVDELQRLWLRLRALDGEETRVGSLALAIAELVK